MCTATITYTKNRREIDLLLSVIKKLGAIVSIDNTDDDEYNPDMVRKVEEGRAAYREGIMKFWISTIYGNSSFSRCQKRLGILATVR